MLLHPQSCALAVFTSTQQCDWDEHLPFVLWAYRTAVQESEPELSPAALMFGDEFRPQWI